MRLGNALALLTLACPVASVSAAGEVVPLDLSLTPGMHVRVLAPDISPIKVVGTIRRVDDQSVTLDVPGRNEPVSILREKIARLDVSDGPRSRGIDAAIGAGIGAGIGAAGGALTNSGGHDHFVSTGAVVGFCAVLGAGLGALIGVAIPPGERCKEMSATRYRISFAPRLDHGADLAVALKFLVGGIGAGIVRIVAMRRDANGSQNSLLLGIVGHILFVLSSYLTTCGHILFVLSSYLTTCPHLAY
jgi:hypothetical protein